MTVDVQTAFGQPTGNFENVIFEGNPLINPTVAFGITVVAVDGLPVSLSLAMQLAIWEVVSDTDLSLSGASNGFRVGSQSDASLADVVALAESWLNGLSLSGIDSSYVSRKYVPDALAHPEKQDLLFLTNISEPSSMVLVATSAVAFLRRRRR